MFDTEEEAAALGTFVAQNESAIINALALHAERMSEASASARAEYEKGQAGEAVRTPQDATMITNNGYRQFANMFGQEADKCWRIIAEIQRMLADPDDGDDEIDEDDDQASDGELHTRVVESVGDPGK